MLGVAATARGLCRLNLKVDPLLFHDELETRYNRSAVEDDLFFAKVKEILKGYFAGTVADFHIDIDFIEGTSFQRRVWKTLLEIPYGEVRSYAWVAERIGNPKAVRAVGQANGRNPVAIIVPCHRVIRNDGTIGGYGGGVEVKAELLRREGVDVPALENHGVTVQSRLRL
jgi:O-6-methylguanine DNA methyltransferase